MDDSQFHALTPRQRAAWHLREAAGLLESCAASAQQSPQRLPDPIRMCVSAVARRLRAVAMGCAAIVWSSDRMAV